MYSYLFLLSQVPQQLYGWRQHTLQSTRCSSWDEDRIQIMDCSYALGSSWIKESKFQIFSGSTWPCPILSYATYATTMRRQCDDKGYILSGRNHGRCGLDRLRNCKALASRHPILLPDVLLHFSWIFLILVYSDLSPCFNSSTTVKHIWNTYVVHMLCTCCVSPRSEAHFLLRTLPPEARCIFVRCRVGVVGVASERREVRRVEIWSSLAEQSLSHRRHCASLCQQISTDFIRFHHFWSVKHIDKYGTHATCERKMCCMVNMVKQSCSTVQIKVRVGPCTATWVQLFHYTWKWWCMVVHGAVWCHASFAINGFLKRFLSVQMNLKTPQFLNVFPWFHVFAWILHFSQLLERAEKVGRKLCSASLLRRPCFARDFTDRPWNMFGRWFVSKDQKLELALFNWQPKGRSRGGAQRKECRGMPWCFVWDVAFDDFCTASMEALFMVPRMLDDSGWFWMILFALIFECLRHCFPHQCWFAPAFLFSTNQIHLKRLSKEFFENNHVRIHLHIVPTNFTSSHQYIYPF